MTIQELKSQIEAGSVTSDLIIFKDTENNFISNQYIQAIRRLKNQEIQYLDSPLELIQDAWSIFGDEDTTLEDHTLRVIKSDSFNWSSSRIADLKNVIIVVSKFADKSIEKLFEPWTVNVPKIEDWMLKDYVYSTTEGVAQKDLDWLINLCGKNRDRLQMELDKLNLFGVDERKYLFNDLIRDGAVDDLSSYSIFNFTNAITSKDLKMLMTIYKELDRVDVNEFGLLTILVKNFKNILMVQLTANPTPESTGIDGKQLYAIKRIPRVYSADQLVKIYQMLLDIDRQVKSGELPTDILIDYIVIKILSA